ncbi:uncharacterized protein EV420DRAFT_1485706 [Desarmillaria tabescens]|uniref:C2H2-type domain-containing protein n=1 Tax=Armillaria tabescens TaxID=1929756 RepID=A0AA39JEE5_ARMTA|nr:uncharacterized protein EV420DRAFT_1485706 [Desarmillaria tabescens]KAK0441250.1 hypothetical protein EV420DRAFT_1485706 [Desarmillaria tabescens]
MAPPSTKPRPNLCSTCKKTYVTKANLRRHSKPPPPKSSLSTNANHQYQTGHPSSMTRHKIRKHGQASTQKKCVGNKDKTKLEALPVALQSSSDPPASPSTTLPPLSPLPLLVPPLKRRQNQGPLMITFPSTVTYQPYRTPICQTTVLRPILFHACACRRSLMSNPCRIPRPYESLGSSNSLPPLASLGLPQSASPKFTHFTLPLRSPTGLQQAF